MSTGEDNFFSPLILDRLIEKEGFRGDSELARFLGVPRQTVYSWRERGAVDLKIITSRCKDMDFNWLLKGTPTAQPSPEASEGAQDLKRAFEIVRAAGFVPLDKDALEMLKRGERAEK